MKAEINGIKFEGTPKEIAEVIKLAGLTPEPIQVPIPTYPVPIPIYPQTPQIVWPYQPWTVISSSDPNTIDCRTGTYTTSCGTSPYSSDSVMQ